MRLLLGQSNGAHGSRWLDFVPHRSGSYIVEQMKIQCFESTNIFSIKLKKIWVYWDFLRFPYGRVSHETMIAMLTLPETLCLGWMNFEAPIWIVSIYKAKFIHPAQRVQVIASKVFDGLVKGLPNLEGYFFLLIHVFLQEFLQLRRYLVFSICTSGLLSFWHHIAGDMGSWHSKWGLNTTTYGMSVAT